MICLLLSAKNQPSDKK